MMLAPHTLLKGINLETVTPAEALAFVQKLAAETLDRMSSDYYVRRLKAAVMVADAANGRILESTDDFFVNPDYTAL